ncbi:Thiol:disulfide interchange protein DsbD [Rhodobacteraceae bacterium THAF1]|uniref:cytochrome c biogenesis CcdA family protein n=1 Tax=Palleronia sp. THAF1 TaxID=2587842 RepID=UPI000F3ABAFC|nr:cytochrome c biogenesis protein CcdA [Palleronia sp. THAF1]QFU09067.1 Thiol:disulfide interchange protein DsbD [Palleronia sp. THAF1]VDC24132.1 Thiol:disulfide interchange protein DsbD [Rhodobacteraceae bacterium THAF1]
MFDVTLGGAVFAGLLSFLSPCILPMVPFYLGYLAGGSVQAVGPDGQIPAALRTRAILGALCFAAGVITIFVLLGASATSLGQVLRDWFDLLRYVAAGLIGLMGLHFLGILRIPILYRQFRAEPGDVSNLSLAGAYVVGLAFAFGWTPCVGPVLAAILFTAAGADSASRGAFLLLGYGIGMTAPFVFAAAFVGPFTRFMVRFRRHLGTVEKVMGALLLLFAVLIATNSVNAIAQWMIETFPVFTRFG